MRHSLSLFSLMIVDFWNGAPFQKSSIIKQNKLSEWRITFLQSVSNSHTGVTIGLIFTEPHAKEQCLLARDS